MSYIDILVAANLAIKIVFAAFSNVIAVLSAFTARPIPTNIAVVAPIGELINPTTALVKLVNALTAGKTTGFNLFPIALDKSSVEFVRFLNT